MTDDNAWKIIENLNWPGGNVERIKELFRDTCTLNEQVELLEFMDAKWELLYLKLEAAHLPDGNRDDADRLYDAITNGIGRGRQAYEAALADLSLVDQWYDEEPADWDQRPTLYGILLKVTDESLALAE